MITGNKRQGFIKVRAPTKFDRLILVLHFYLHFEFSKNLKYTSKTSAGIVLVIFEKKCA